MPPMRAQVFEQATCLVGVYSCLGASRLVTSQVRVGAQPLLTTGGDVSFNVGVSGGGGGGVVTAEVGVGGAARDEGDEMLPA